MQFEAKPSTPAARFAWIVRGASHGPDAAFDEDLADFAEAAVVPTRGALVAEWLLVVPRTPCLSVAELDRPHRARILAIANAVSVRMPARAGASVTFEHGPGRQGSATGCGVDQAHLHVVGGVPHLLERLVDAVGDASWSAADYDDPWAAIPSGSDYLMIRDRHRAVRARVSSPTSQRLRRALASVLGLGDEWDYRSHPNERNARLTREMFRGAFADASA